MTVEERQQGFVDVATKLRNVRHDISLIRERALDISLRLGRIAAVLEQSPESIQFDKSDEKLINAEQIKTALSELPKLLAEEKRLSQLYNSFAC